MANFMWIEGTTRSGKTTRLLSHLKALAAAQPESEEPGAVFLVFAANGDNRLVLADRLAEAVPADLPVTTATPAGFIQNEVILFWPVLVESLGLSPQFPMKLRPENEQELATQVWRQALDDDRLAVPGWTEPQIVRRSLDFLQLAASGGIPAEDLETMLPEGIPAGVAPVETWREIGQAVVRWRDWCLRRGLLTYGIATELYWRHLLPHPTYQARLSRRFCGLLADDLDEYPAVFQALIASAQTLELPSAITWNPDGKVRLGVGADPEMLERLRHEATTTEILARLSILLADSWADPVVTAVLDPITLPEPIEAIQCLQTTSRGELLRKTAEAIAQAIHDDQVPAGEIAVIGPGFDAIARYTLAEILQKQGIPVASLNDQRPLVSTPLVRAVLTLIPFIYPGLGRHLDRDAVAEMLVVLSQSVQGSPTRPWFDRVQIDPVRAELIADHCFQPDPDQPDLLEVNEFPRWDRLGYEATEAYNTLRNWVIQQRQARQQRLITTPVNLMDRAIQAFLWRGNYLPYDQLAALRELMETAQHFWEVEGRLQLQQRFSGQPLETDQSAESRFLQLLHQGIVTANPFPVKPLEHGQQGVTLSTVFQYRSQRLTHRWQFWLDAGSPRWLTGTDALFGYPIFLGSWSGQPWTVAFIEEGHEARLDRILRDLLGRTTERVILCHSDLAVNGQEQTGPLLTLVNVAGEYLVVGENGEEGVGKRE
ncbi:MAG: hypothetical protein F6K42_12940 [Leptolyngbya sp. SIO1D8]|nr:hypothetical protein [Leptolyngbya sp. SIO1D8]